MWRLSQPIHSSWRIATVCAAFIVGVGCAAAWTVSVWWGLLLIPCLIALLFGRWLWMLFLTTIIAWMLGLTYGSLHVVSRSVYDQLIGKEVSLSGRVKEDLSVSESGSKSIQIDTIVINGNNLPGTLLATGRQDGGALRGDRIFLTGTMKPGFGSFPASVNIGTISKVEREWPGDVGRVVRDGFADNVRRVIPDPQASLGIGFLTGQKSALPPDLADALKIVGLTHTVVASGYNLTILVRMARKVFINVSKYISAVSSVVMILAFMTVTGLSPSMTRAGLVSGMSLMAWYYGHGFHPFVLLPVAAAITVAFQPSYVWGDMGWQLSFSAFAGVMIVAPLLQRYFFGDTPPGIPRQILGETLAAHLVTIPIITGSFGTLSNVAIIANLMVVPFVPLAMLLTFCCGIGSLVGLPFIEILAVPTMWLLTYMTGVATSLADLPWAQSTMTVASILWLAYSVALGCGCWWMWHKTRYNFRTSESGVI